MKVLVVGSGTAGLITACVLKKHLDIDVSVVSSKDIGIIGVGEGTTEHLAKFIDFIGIDRDELVARSDATYKTGILFEGWTSKPYFYSICEDFARKIEQDRYVFQRQVGLGSDLLYPRYTRKSKVPLDVLKDKNNPITLQYHLNTFKLNEYLVDVCKLLGITFYEDKINEVIVDETGQVTSLKGEARDYQYDFYVDSTGFRRLIIGKLGAKWQSYSKFLKMNSAFVFQTPDEEEYNMWTHVEALNNGWKFKIPVWGRHGNGYVYDGNYTSEEDAVREVENKLGQKIQVARTFKFDPGSLDKFWISNCCAVGLSGSFAEPLEATAISTSIQQAFLLASNIVGYSKSDIASYNKSVTSIMENTRDFIFLHYMVDRTDTPFWNDMSKVEPPVSLADQLEMWRTRLPMQEDFSGSSSYILFTESHYTMVLEGIGKVDRKSILNRYAHLSKRTKDMADQIVNWYDTESDKISTLPHKEVVRLVRKSRGL
jgi:tryptophan halogenase